MSVKALKTNVFQDLFKEEFEKDKRDILLKVGFAGQTYIAFIVNAIEQILNDEIVSRIRTKIVANGYSQKIADAVHLAASPISTGPGKISWDVISDYTTDEGFPVAVMIENGRIAYTIFPKGKDQGGSDWLVFEIKDSGKTIFTKKSKIPRFIPTKYVRDTVRERKNIIQEKVNLATQRFITDIIQDNSLP